jgi:Reverse transcriptase (RNA-dependent DNA polymerase)
MYGVQIPRNHAEAMELDAKNGNTKWRDAELVKLAQIDEYETFSNRGQGHYPGKDYKRINVHFVYAAKPDRLKARLVAGGHLTDTPVKSVYSSVVSLRGVRLVAFLAELNGLQTWSTGVENAYLESFTKEKVYIIAGPEFGDRQGHTFVIVKALYGLKSSGLRWRERFADVLKEMGFSSSRAEPDIWMRDRGDHYEYIAVYLDDLLIASYEPDEIVKTLEELHKFKLKGSGPTSFHLGCDFFRDKDGVLCYAPKKYILRMLDTFERLFGKQPKQYVAPLEGGDHPELDDSELLEIEDIKVYQSLIGALQWVIQIGRFDITTHVMTLSRFRAAPRHGHLDRVKRIYGYLSKMRHGVIRIRTELPDYSVIPEKTYDWDYTCYEGAEELIPDDMPRPLGKEVQTTTFVDANLYHDLISGRSVTGVLHLLNKTPIDWFSKLQSTVETATFGSEYVAARTATEQIIDLHNTLRYLGVPVRGVSMMFGDNETVVNTASVPHARLLKRHVALS